MSSRVQANLAWVGEFEVYTWFSSADEFSEKNCGERTVAEIHVVKGGF